MEFKINNGFNLKLINLDNVANIAEQTQAIDMLPIGKKGSIQAGQRRMRTETVASHAAPTLPDELVLALVKYGNNPDGLPALHAAIKAKDEKIVRLFLDHGADPNAKAADTYEPCQSALEFAAAFGNRELVDLLIDRGAILTSSSLGASACFGNIETMRCLLEKGADMYGFPCVGRTVMECAIQSQNDPEGNTIKTLVAYGYDLNRIIPNPTFKSWLHLPLRAALHDEKKFELLLRLGANPNIKLENGKSIAHAYSMHGGIDWMPTSTLEIFIKYGGNINARDQDGKTPLFYAKKANFKEWINILIANGAKE